MTTPSDFERNDRELEADLGRLAQTQAHQRAPAALHAAIRQNVHSAMQAQMLQTQAAPSASTTIEQRLWRWLNAHWWRMAYLGSTAAAVPLLTGALLGYQLTNADDALADPASEWLTSYSSITESSDAGAIEDLLP